MIRLRSHVSVTHADDRRLIMQSSMGRRLLFGGISLLLLVSFVVGMDWDEGIEEGMIVGTIFYFSITAVCAAVAGWNSQLVLDRDDRRVHFIRKLFGIPVRSAALPLDDVTGVVIRGIRFLKESEKPRVGLFSNRMHGYMERRNVYHKLYLETNERAYLVEDSSDLSDLEAAARAIAAFLEVDYRREEL